VGGDSERTQAVAAGARAFIDRVAVDSGAARSRLTSRVPIALVIGDRRSVRGQSLTHLLKTHEILDRLIRSTVSHQEPRKSPRPKTPVTTAIGVPGDDARERDPPYRGVVTGFEVDRSPPWGVRGLAAGETVIAVFR